MENKYRKLAKKTNDPIELNQLVKDLNADVLMLRRSKQMEYRQHKAGAVRDAAMSIFTNDLDDLKITRDVITTKIIKLKAAIKKANCVIRPKSEAYYRLFVESTQRYVSKEKFELIKQTVEHRLKESE